jgi:arylsulfatase A-like enzyme
MGEVFSMNRTPGRDDVFELRDAAQAALEAGRDEEARRKFSEASRLSCEVLVVADPARLAVAGAHADAWYDHWRDVEKAFEIARTAYDDAISGIDDAVGEQYREAVRELGELRDRLTFWAFKMASS